MVYDGRMYSLNRDLPLSYDVHEFEAALRQAAELGAAFSITSEQRQEMRNLLQHAIQRWRGEFLQDLDAGEWAILRREQLRLAYLRALLDLGQVHFLEGDYAAAQDAYLTVLKEDPYLELAHREWMRCLTRQGESAQATQHYQKLKSLLADELKAAPSYETTLLYERIRRGDDV
jgi:DNA-binding SARP family transcriptional activator